MATLEQSRSAVIGETKDGIPIWRGRNIPLKSRGAKQGDYWISNSDIVYRLSQGTWYPFNSIHELATHGRNVLQNDTYGGY